MLKHVAFWAFVFLPFSTGILPIRYSTTNFCHSLWFLKCNFRPLFPHWRNWKKMLHRRDPRWNYGHWKLQGITFFYTPFTRYFLKLYDFLCYRSSFMTQGPMGLHLQVLRLECTLKSEILMTKSFCQRWKELSRI